LGFAVALKWRGHREGANYADDPESL